MDRRNFVIAAAAGLGAAASGGAALGARRRPVSRDIARAVEAALGRLDFIPGLAVAIYSREDTFAAGFGVADIDTGEPATPDTAFYIASSTKPLTALSLALAAQRGRIDLDATLADFAPDAEFPPSVRPAEVRLRDLLTHTSGIVNNPIVMRLAFTGDHDGVTLHRLLASCEPNEEAPLGAFQYTNAGYNIATILADRRLGEGWKRRLEREIFRPLGMTRTSACLSAASRAGWSVAKGHWGAAPEGLHRLDFEKSDSTMHSAGGVIMSAKDALRWLEFMIESGAVRGWRIAPKTLVASTLDSLAQIKEREDYDAHHYGLGWYLSTYRGEPMAHHFGDFDGFRAHVSFLPARRVGVAIFANESSASWWAVHGFANYVYDRLAAREDAGERLDAAIASALRERDEQIARISADRSEIAALSWSLSRPREAYSGVYENELLGRMEVSLAGDGALFIRLGRLHSVAEPGGRQDAVLVQFFPYRRFLLPFEGDGPRPDAVRFRGMRFTRR